MSLITDSLEGVYTYNMRLVRERFEGVENFTDLFAEDDGLWHGNLGNKNYRIMYFLRAAFLAGSAAGALGHFDQEDSTFKDAMDWLNTKLEEAE